MILMVGAASEFVTSAGTDAVGKTFVIYGNAAGFGASFDVATLDGSNGFTIHGVTHNAGAGVRLAKPVTSTMMA
jgi:hypothetical protein